MISGHNYDPLQRQYGNLQYNGCVVATTNGTTPVTVSFTGSSTNGTNTTGAPRMDVLAVVVNALDTTAGNISLTIAGNTVATVAKGTSAGVLTGATSLSSNTGITNGASVTVVSSSAGNAQVLVYFNAY